MTAAAAASEATPAASGLFLTLEGGDGAGKTTQAALLEDWLVARGRRVVRTREPGGTEVGAIIRDIVLHHRGDVSPRAEALLYAADRAHHVATVVRPALDRGDVVVQDRYLDSSVAYQGAGRVLGADEVRDLSLWATPFDRREAERDDCHARVRPEFLRLAAAEPGRFLVLDATAPADDIAAAVRTRVSALLDARTS